jgi:hypothetical protein
MKQNIIIAMFISLGFTIIISLLHLMIWSCESCKIAFENYFGMTVNTFIWWKYLIVWLVISSATYAIMYADERRFKKASDEKASDEK